MNYPKHKFQLLRLLKAIVDTPQLRDVSFFKGGTCAMLLGWLDRFSVDLDFDIDSKADISEIRNEFKKLFSKLDLEIKDESHEVLEFSLKYSADPNERNTIVVDALGPVYKTNQYEKYYFPELDRFVFCQTQETMFANKLVAVTSRVEKGQRMAARDIYDIYYFYTRGFKYNPQTIVERTGMSVKDYLQKTLVLIEKQLTQQTIDEDLNSLLPPQNFRKTRLTLREDVILLLRQEMLK